MSNDPVLTAEMASNIAAVLARNYGTMVTDEVAALELIAAGQHAVTAAPPADLRQRAEWHQAQAAECWRKLGG